MTEKGSGLRKDGLTYSYAQRAYGLAASCACSVIVFAALFCSLGVKLFHAERCGLLSEYPSWILSDIAVLVGLTPHWR